jgi:O-antigen/teichoic acid export membrane protein
LFTTTIIARSVGPELYGRYTFGLNFILIFSVLANFGLESLYIREAARDRSNVGLISDIFRLKVLLAVTTALFTVAAAHLLDYPGPTLMVIYVLAVGLVFQILGESLLSVYRATEQMHVPALASTLFRGISATIIAVSVFGGIGFYGVVAAYTIANALIFLGAWFVARKHLRLRLPTGFRGRAFALLRNGMPFYQSALLTMFYGKIGVLLLSKFASEFEMGFYMAGLTLVETLYFIPTAFITALFPAFSRIFGASPDALRQAYERIIKYLVILTAAVAVGTLLVAESVIALIFGAQFMPAADALRVLIFFWVFGFFNQTQSTLLFSIGKERVQVAVMLFACGTNLVLTWGFLAAIGYLGAGVASVLTEAAVVLVISILLWRSGYRAEPWRFVVQLCLALGAMASVVHLLLPVHILIAIPAGAGAFLLGLFVFRVFDEQDLRLLRAIASRRPLRGS